MPQEREPRVFANRWGGASGSTGGDGPIMDGCDCIEYVGRTRTQGPTRFHSERQDTSAPGWIRLLELIEQAADDGREVFKPLVELTAEQRRQIVSLPPTIAKLKAVKHLVLYRSNLVRIPPEIGNMDNLEEFTPYTSYRLHWFPYEITRCANLQRSTMSTRAVYGNFSTGHRSHSCEPRLSQQKTSASETLSRERGAPQPYPPAASATSRSTRSTCGRSGYRATYQATMSCPLLVNACSAECVEALPEPAAGYVQRAHTGGPSLEQPPAT